MPDERLSASQEGFCLMKQSVPEVVTESPKSVTGPSLLLKTKLVITNLRKVK
jgi:hypothetical protein